MRTGNAGERIRVNRMAMQCSAVDVARSVGNASNTVDFEVLTGNVRYY